MTAIHTPVVVHQHPFSAEVRREAVPLGSTLEQIVAAAGIAPDYHCFVQVWIGDNLVPRQHWGRVTPKEGAHVFVRAVPMGGGGEGGGGKSFLSSILMLGVVVASAAFAPGIAAGLFPGLSGTGLSLATGLIGAGISMVGALAVSSLIPPASQDESKSQRALLSGVRNQFAPYANIPRHFGKRRVYPLQAARPYTEAQGDNRFLRVLLAVGIGPLKISEIKIGDTPIEAYDAVTVETREGWHSDHAQFGALPPGVSPDTPQTIFTKQVREETFNILLDDAGLDGAGNAIDTPGPWETRVTEEGCSEVSVDVTLPYGLAYFKDNGDVSELRIDIAVEYRLVGAASWTPVVWSGNDEADGTQTNGLVIAQDASRTATTRGGRWILPAVGQYEVRMRRVSKRAMPEKKHAQRVEWTAIRSIKPENPVNMPGMALIALRMKATDQLNGIPDTINCIVESYLPTYDGTSWAWAINKNPAFAYADLARRRGTTRMISDQRLHLSDIQTWAVACDQTAPNAAEPYWTFNSTIESGSVFDGMRLIASHGRASFTIRDGKYSVVRDVAQTVPVQHITPRNSWGYSGSKAFLDLPHALKMQFINAANGYQEDEIIVYADGYSEDNATRFESMDLVGCTSPTMAWREGRYHLAVGKLRPEEHTVNMDIEALRCTLGDYVVLSHDVLSIGIASARIVGLVTSGGNTTGVMIDNIVPQEAGQSYSIRVRSRAGVSTVLPIAVRSGSSADVDTLTLAAPVATASGPQVGDLVTYGQTGLETAPMIVKRIEPGPNMTAKLTLVDAQPGVWTADTSAIPAFQTYVSDDTPVVQQRPPAPSFSLASDENVIIRLADGTLQDRIGVTIGALPSSKVAVTDYEVHFKRSEEVDWRQALVSKISIRRTFIAPVLQGASYDVRVRTVSQYGQASEWAVASGHVVIGKTTPPESVTGLTAESRVDGIQLAWAANAEVDIAGYQVRRGDDWDTAEVVTSIVSGTLLFVALTVSGDQRFMVRAVDVIGLMSPSQATVTASVIRPDDVEWMMTYPQGDNITFKWKTVSGSGVQYEIRNGADWVTARRVTVTSGDTKTVKWPIRADGSTTFMIKAVSAAGLASANPCVSNAPQNASENRNVIAETDFSADTWAGTRVGMEAVGTGAGSLLTVSQAWDGLSYARGDYFRAVNLGAEFYARNWIELSAIATSGAGLDWASANTSWDDSGSLTWGGAIISDADISATAYISIKDGSVPATLIDAISCNGSTTSRNGATATVTGTVAYAPLRPGQGFVSDQASLQWSVAIPSVYTAMMDFLFSPPMDDYALMVMGIPADPETNPSTAAQKAGNFGILRIRDSVSTLATFVTYDGLAGELKIGASGQPTVSVAMPLEQGDLVTIAISQEAASRAVFSYHHRLKQVFSATSPYAAPVAPMNRVLAYVFGQPMAPGVMGNFEFHNAAMTAAQFAAQAPFRSLIGYAPYKELVPGDYGYQNAMVWISAEVGDRALDLTVTSATHCADVPDLVRRGTVAVGTSGATVTFPAGFHAAPDLTLTQIGGATMAVTRVTGLTASGFTVQLFDAANPATAVAGTISYQAFGY